MVFIGDAASCLLGDTTGSALHSRQGFNSCSFARPQDQWGEVGCWAAEILWATDGRPLCQNMSRPMRQ